MGGGKTVEKEEAKEEVLEGLRVRRNQGADRASKEEGECGKK